MRKIVVNDISKPYENPFIRSPRLNPIRKYDADVVEDGRTKEKLTGVIFANQKPSEQIKHHALLRGHGDIPIEGKGVSRMEKLK